MEMNPANGEFAATMKSFMAPPRFRTSDGSRGMVAYLAGAEAGFVTGANLSAPDCDGTKRLTRTNPDELEFHEGAWFGKARLMKSRPALAIRPWRDTRWGVKLSIDRPHLLSHQSSRDRESRVGLELARDFASRGLRG